MQNNPATVGTSAPVPKTVERQGVKSVPYTKLYPQVRGGVCEHCGIIDGNVDSQHQYKLCQHYRGLELRCSYCDESKNPEEIAYRSTLNVHGHPSDPNKLVVVCDSYNCSRAHIERFSLSN